MKPLIVNLVIIVSACCITAGLWWWFTVWVQINDLLPGFDDIASIDADYFD